MNPRISIVLVSLLVVGAGVYAWLGGFHSPEKKEMNLPGYMLTGIPFRGNARDERLGEIFSRIRQFHTEKLPENVLVALYFRQKIDNPDSVNAFIGVIVKDSLPALPNGFTYQRLESGKGIRVSVRVHPLLFSPERLQAALYEYASTKSYQLEDYVLEKYISEGEYEMETRIR
jgi:hypothetical protein